MHGLCQNFVLKVASFNYQRFPSTARSYLSLLSDTFARSVHNHQSPLCLRAQTMMTQQYCCLSWLGQKEKVKVWKSSDLELLTSLIGGCRKMTKVSAISAAVRRTQAALHHGHLHHHQGHEEQQPGVEQEGQGGPHLSGHHQSWCRSGAGQVATSSTWDCAGGSECTRVVWTPPAPSCTRVLERTHKTWSHHSRPLPVRHRPTRPRWALPIFSDIIFSQQKKLVLCIIAIW